DTVMRLRGRVGVISRTYAIASNQTPNGLPDMQKSASRCGSRAPTGSSGSPPPGIRTQNQWIKSPDNSVHRRLWSSTDDALPRRFVYRRTLMSADVSGL